jgi:hypothetical protein
MSERCSSQVDVVFPFDRELQAAFSKLETEYYTSRAPLAEIYESLRTYGQEPGLAKYVFVVVLPADMFSKCCTTSDAQVASTGTFLPDAWSSWEGSVILNTGKETFEALGLPGTKLSTRMSGAPEQHSTHRFHDLLLLLIPILPLTSDQHLTEHAGRKHSKPRFYPRFIHTMGSITRRLG